MAIQTFNETFLGNAEVPATGSKSGAARPANYDDKTSATGMPSAVQSFDPAANLRTTAVTKQAPRANTSGGKAKFIPATVAKFSDGVV